MEFEHIGLITKQRHEGEVFVEATKVWVTDYKKHPYSIEWLRYEADSPVIGPVRTQPHIAFRVDDIYKASHSLKVFLEPFDVGFAVVGFYQTEDGAVIEFMQYK